ncbi:MAG TPA: hypothetical protein EYP58_04975, partial [bacterium (Candidatus Stahlbacteria)]|nr:hypothetical protein [Candidatus Stahlbacteria bacterium]
MNLVVLSSRKNISNIADIKVTEKAVKSYLDSFPGTSYLLYHDAPPFPLDGVPSDPDAILTLLLAFEDKFNPIDYLTILGGDEIIPFFKLPNPCDDDDQDVLSDNPYASRDDEYLVPERAVGRIPSAGNGQFMIDQLTKKTLGEGAFGISAKVWIKASEQVYRVVGNVGDLKTAPPVTIEGFDKT